jgi:hypothetical protein
MDAEYCAEIIKVIHQEKTPVFYTLRLYDLVRDAPIFVAIVLNNAAASGKACWQDHLRL